jgi:hypothetical protein
MQLIKEVAKKAKQKRLIKEATSKVAYSVFDYLYKIKEK